MFLSFLVDDCILMYLEITILCIYNFLILYGYLFGFFFLYTLAPICLKSWVRPWNRLTYREQYKSCTWDQSIQIGILSHKMSVDSITQILYKQYASITQIIYKNGMLLSFVTSYDHSKWSEVLVIMYSKFIFFYVRANLIQL